MNFRLADPAGPELGFALIRVEPFGKLKKIVYKSLAKSDEKGI
jgi:hypothetical protein